MKNLINISTIIFLVMFTLSGCALPHFLNNNVSQNANLSEGQLSERVTAVCKMATLEVEYHNVGTTVKEAGKKFENWGEKDKTYWVEYIGTAKLGLDAGKVRVRVDEDNVFVRLPNIEILDIDFDGSSFIQYESDDSFFNKNALTPEEKDATVSAAQKEMESKILEMEKLDSRALDNAKSIIENFIVKVGDSQGVSYKIIWE